MSLLWSCQKKELQGKSLKNTLNISFQTDPSTLDSRKNSDPASCQMIFLLFEGLTKLEADGSVSLNLAKSIDITHNRMKYTFHLKDSKWSDNEPVTAHDFVYAWKTLLDPKFPSLNAFFLYCIENAKKAKQGLVEIDKVGVYALDDETLVVKLEYPTPYFLEMLTFCTYFPIPKHIVENSSNWPIGNMKPFVSNGAFVLKEWQHSNQITLVKNQSNWNKNNVSIEQVNIQIIPDPLTNLNLFQNEKLDFIGAFYSPIPTDAINFFKTKPSYFTKEFAGTECCFFNTDCYPLNNVNIRKALYYAIDRKQIVENITQTNQKEAYALIPPQLKHSQLKLLPHGSKELSEQYFKKGLKELGITRDQFPKLTFSYFLSNTNKKIAQYLQETWLNTLKLNFNIEGLDIKTFLDRINNRNFQFCLMSIMAQYNDPYNYFERFLYLDNQKNYSGYENVKYQNLIAISNDCITKSERFKLLEKAETILLSDLPCGPLFHYSTAYLMNPKMKGLIITPISTINFSKVSFND